jgi:hypothetical protein
MFIELIIFFLVRLPNVELKKLLYLGKQKKFKAIQSERKLQKNVQQKGTEMINWTFRFHIFIYLPIS